MRAAAREHAEATVRAQKLLEEVEELRRDNDSLHAARRSSSARRRRSRARPRRRRVWPRPRRPRRPAHCTGSRARCGLRADRATARGLAASRDDKQTSAQARATRARARHPTRPLMTEPSPSPSSESRRRRSRLSRWTTLSTRWPTSAPRARQARRARSRDLGAQDGVGAAPGRNVPPRGAAAEVARRARVQHGGGGARGERGARGGARRRVFEAPSARSSAHGSPRCCSLRRARRPRRPRERATEQTRCRASALLSRPSCMAHHSSGGGGECAGCADAPRGEERLNASLSERTRCESRARRCVPHTPVLRTLLDDALMPLISPSYTRCNQTLLIGVHRSRLSLPLCQDRERPPSRPRRPTSPSPDSSPKGGRTDQAD